MRVDGWVEKFRLTSGQYGTKIGETNGMFAYVPRATVEMNIIISDGGDWEHVSVNMENRCPNWPEMCWVKSLFWDDEETVMQLHPPKSEWVSNMSNCLHLWRPLKATMPRPPNIMVGIKALGKLD